MSRIPTSTYRMQFHKDFQFSDAQRLVGYLERLGIGDLYASPILTSQAGSMHGYDVTDPTRLNPELGGKDDFRGLVSALREREMGLLVDIVPNHMAASLENPWWVDVLKHGSKSAHATYFDIDWESTTPGLAGKVLLPVLGGPFGEVLERGELTLAHDGDNFVIAYFDSLFPVSSGSLELIQHRDDSNRAIESMNGTPGDATSFDKLATLIDAQHYRLAYWQAARDTINYRRFFDVSDLVSLRAEDEEVFQATHQRILELVNDGDVTGLRIDHVDGLRDPASYLERLQAALPIQENSGRNGFYVVVEKILAANEDVPDDWPVDGTSGYDFLNVLNGLFVDRGSAGELDRIYGRLRGSESDFEELVYQRKQQVMAELFAGEIHRLAVQLWEIAAADRDGHDLALSELQAALIEIIAHLNVYRSYTRGMSVASADRERIETAVSKALERTPEYTPALRFARKVLLLDVQASVDNDGRESWLRFAMRWQQYTGPIMAKGFEDTSLYVYNRLNSLNEVGGDPDPAGVPLAEFHAWCEGRQDRWHGAMSATSTHDTKRSEDVRARINVLSEMSEEWGTALARWQQLNREKKAEVNGLPAPDGNEDHLIYETMLGAWPFSDDDLPEFRERMKAYLLKASREAKTHTSWIDQSAEYEHALTGFIDRIITDGADDPFLHEFRELQQTTAFHGALNSLSQTLLKTCLPGVPDFYQGSELWDLSLVDPDNRRPVDYEWRAELLEDLLLSDGPQLVEHLLRDWENGRVKLYLTFNALRARKARPDLFNHGAYIPLTVEGEMSRHVVVFARHHGDSWAIVAAPRLTVELARQCDLATGEVPLGERYWREMTVTIPAAAPDRWENALTGETLECQPSGSGKALPVARLFGRLPVALLTSAL
ncbi:MAG: malto-oligosyltrehalose synthase [Chloroflexia bacterium]|nr:malto-oligosyltrehalose synthase [Chloroflexia bacterium]